MQSKGKIDGLGVLAVGVVGAGMGYVVTLLVKQYAPALWFAWLLSGAAIAFVLSRWRPTLWVLAASATVSIVLAQTILSLRHAPPTAAALGAGFALVWAGLAFLGALAGRNVSASSTARPEAPPAREGDAKPASRADA
jgi:hypothetical protein